MTLRPAIPLRQYRGHVIRTAPTVEPVTPAEMAALLVIEETQDDTLIAGMITEARQEIEDVTGIAMVTQSWRLSLDRWPGALADWWDGIKQIPISELYANSPVPWVHLPRYPLQTVDTVTVFNEAGDPTAVTVGNVFDVDPYQHPGRMALKRGQTWPIALRAINAIQIDYTAGYGNVASVPAPLKRAIKVMVSHMYEHRGCAASEAYHASGAAAIAGRYRVVSV
jgi:uncharacterized phiE125 gp8 family phage protein